MKRGILSGLGAYLIWGFIPIYFKLLQSVPALEIMFHRVVWSLVFLGILLSMRKQWEPLRQALRQPRLLGIYGLAALLLAANWWIYIYGVNSGQVVETSLGYFINPLLSIALGVIFLRERPRPRKSHAERSAEGCAEHPYGGASKTLFLVAVSAACTILEERDQPFALFQRPDK